MKEADKRSFNELATIIKRLKKDKKLYDSYTKDYENGIACIWRSKKERRPPRKGELCRRRREYKPPEMGVYDAPAGG